jgi:hypothetical protein
MEYRSDLTEKDLDSAYFKVLDTDFGELPFVRITIGAPSTDWVRKKAKNWLASFSKTHPIANRTEVIPARSGWYLEIEGDNGAIVRVMNEGVD